jgi:DNA helicase-2/ATP-dependent DNA helicase PcrA
VGVEEGLLPHERSNNDEDELEEERRLFFVGVTRAKADLFISYARYRTIRGQMLRTIPSQFLYELGTDFVGLAAEDNSSSLAENDDNTTQFAVGQLVLHEEFGLGKVKKFVDMGEDSIVIVKFNTGQTKSLMLKYAPLSKI